MSGRTFTDTRDQTQHQQPISGSRLSGAVIVDKPLEWTSHDVVNKLRRLAGTRKIGHLGTLDPNATGVLPLLIGPATRLARFFGAAEKSYEGVVRFGFSTDTCDVKGSPTSSPVDFHPRRDDLEQALMRFRGTFRQIPPAVSAKKIGGVPAYRLARSNKPVDLAPVNVEVSQLEITFVDRDEVGLRIRCSAGTYVRAIAHDLGQIFACGAHLKSLRRTAAGEFTIAQAEPIGTLVELANQGCFIDALVPARDLLHDFPCEEVDAITEGFIRQGRDFRIAPFRAVGEPQYIKAVNSSGDLVAIGEIQLPNVYHPIIVLD